MPATRFMTGWKWRHSGCTSPSALAEYGIEIPVMNLGLGVERLAMILYHSDDVRQTHPSPVLPGHAHRPPDRQGSRITGTAGDPVGRRMAAAIRKTAAVHAAEPGPCSFIAWEDEFAGHRVKVFVEEPESNTKLCGPACFNMIYAYQGSILGVPDTEKWKDVHSAGISTGITYLDAVASLAAARIEQKARCGLSETVQVKMAKLPSDINIQVGDYAMRTITDNKKKIDLRGPVFLTVRSEIT